MFLVSVSWFDDELKSILNLETLEEVGRYLEKTDELSHASNIPTGHFFLDADA